MVPFNATSSATVFTVDGNCTSCRWIIVKTIRDDSYVQFKRDVEEMALEIDRKIALRRSHDCIRQRAVVPVRQRAQLPVGFHPCAPLARDTC